MRRAELPPGPQELFGDGCRLLIPLRQVVERSNCSWSKLMAAQQRVVGKVLRDWEGAAGQGRAETQFSPGVMYYQAQGAPRDSKEALVW